MCLCLCLCLCLCMCLCLTVSRRWIQNICLFPSESQRSRSLSLPPLPPPPPPLHLQRGAGQEIHPRHVQQQKMKLRERGHGGGWVRVCVKWMESCGRGVGGPRSFLSAFNMLTRVNNRSIKESFTQQLQHTHTQTRHGPSETTRKRESARARETER